jgi:subtilisin family serine protease
VLTSSRVALACVALIICAFTTPAGAAAPAAAPAATALVAGASVHAAAAPDDDLFSEQWSLASERVLGIQSAWRVSSGSGVVVAVIDTGADMTHPDLRDNLWTNTREIPGNGVDDDGDGFVDDVHGWDFVNGDGDPTDDNGHGTHVAGIIAARSNNRTGIAGVAPRARVMVIKALGADAVGTSSTMADAVRYAMAHGARIINMSVSGPGYSQVFADAVQAASDAGVLLVAAAGNSGHDLDVQPEYPAALPAPHLISVAATGRNGQLIGISNRGTATVDIAAPGQGIVSTARGGGYELRTGTSMASPHVAGALALMASARPDLGADALQGALLAGADRGVQVSSGSLDIAASMRRIVSASRWRAARAAAVRRARAARRSRVRAASRARARAARESHRAHSRAR